MIEADLAKANAAMERLEAKIDELTKAIARIRRADGPALKRMSEVAKEYGYPVSTQRLHLKQGILRGTKRGRVVLIDVSQLEPVGNDEVAAMAARARAR